MLRSVARHTPDYFLLMIAEGIIWGCINSAASVFSYKLLNAVDDGTDLPTLPLPLDVWPSFICWPTPLISGIGVSAIRF